MALTDAEVARIKAELGFHLLSVSAEPYIGFRSYFTQILQPYITAGASTTSTTSVTATTTPTPVSVTLASATGFTAGDRVVIDVDERQEIATLRSISGSVINVSLTKAHGTATYPVTVEGGETLVREALTRIRETKAEMAQAFGLGALKRADDIEWHPASGSNVSQFEVMGQNLHYWREELAAILGIQSMWSMRRAGGQRLSVY